MAEKRTPDWLVERLALGELREEEAAAVRERLEREGGLHRLEELARSNEELLSRHPPARIAAEIRSRARPRRDPWKGLSVIVPATAMLALLVLLLPKGEPPGGLDSPETTRSKGADARLFVHRQSADGVELLVDGGEVREGDRLQLSYFTQRPYGAILSVDGRGAVTMHLPTSGMKAARLERGGPHALPHSYELDDAPDHERFFFVTSEAPFDVAGVKEAARRTEGPFLELPAELEQRSFLLRKAR